MNRDFSGKTVVVTGASAGTGRAIVRAFAGRGANVGLLARGAEGLQAAAREVEALGARAIWVPTDVADPDQVERAAEAVERELGPIDVWVNNAMVSTFGPYHAITPAEFRRVTEVTYLGQVYGTGAALARMRPRNKGTIILVGSALAYRGIPLQSAYCGAKHAIHGFFETLRTELLQEGSGVRVGMVQLPAMNTPQFAWVKNYMDRKPKPMGTVYQPEVGAEAVVEMVRTGAREIFVGLSTVEAVVGNKIFPRFMDHVLAHTGFEGQLTDTPENPGRPDNLWEPVPGDFGAQGDFGVEAKEHTFTQWVRSHRGFTTLAASLGLALAAALIGEHR